MEEKEKEGKEKPRGEPLFGQNIRETINAFRNFFRELKDRELKEDRRKQEQEKS